MTLVMALHGERSIWLCTDRRLARANEVKDDGCKVLQIDGTDGVALLGYSGLGSSLSKTQPSDWMNDLLVNKHGLTIEAQLGIIAGATRTDMPPHLMRMPGPQAHHLLASTIVNGEPRLYVVAFQLGPLGSQPNFVFTRYTRTERGGPPPRFGFAGSGAAYLPPGKGWMRELLRIVRGVEAGRVNPLAVADRLAAVNKHVAANDPFVSPQCIIIWRMNGGSYQFYDGTQRVHQDIQIPSVGNGMDMRDICKVMMPIAFKNHEAMKKGETLDESVWDIQGQLDELAKRKLRKL